MIRVDDVCKSFRTVTAVDRVSFLARPGQVTALLGPNGSGKTTLLRMVVGILVPDSGQIELCSAPGANGLHPLGYLPEERGLTKGARIQRTLVHFGTLQGLSRTRAHESATLWLRRLGLLGRAGECVDALSKGNQQKIMIAASLLHSPPIVVLDEPFSGLDPTNQDALVAILEELCAANTTVLISGHEMSLIERVADALVLLREGRVAAAGPVADIRRELAIGDAYDLEFETDYDLRPLFGHPAVRAVDRVRPGNACLVLEKGQALGEVLARSNLGALTSVTRRDLTLRDVYLRTVGSAAPRDRAHPHGGRS